eukprot:GILI01008222.1.p1 GENE.GILI01008222.1~~GILI01008222.1.p1  ORF type:complete len:498 (+),score=153.46 GILI01008222.1:146-1495(+)
MSPLFDPQWETNGLQDQAIQLLVDWAKGQNIKGFTMDVLREAGRTPLIFIEVEADERDAPTVLLYGHMDKQPPFEGWSEGLGPWTPVIKDDKLYGRGGADDGYSIFAALTAIKACQEQGVPHGRCVVLVEACEESGSLDLPYYMHVLADRIGSPSLVVCLDSGCGNYDSLWLTTSLRGMLGATLHVQILTEGVHSGDGSGVVPSTMRIARMLLSRIEDEETGKIIDDFHVQIPSVRIEQAQVVADTLGEEVIDKFPWCDGAKPVQADSLAELFLNKTWRPQLEVTGASGLPPISQAGNVLRPETVLRLSMRLPPSLNCSEAIAKFKEIIEKDPPYGATVRLEEVKGGNGWDSPVMPDWLLESVKNASLTFHGQEPRMWGEGGSIPFMAMLGKKFPEAQFVVTGVLGPHSNAHGPNEFLHIPYTKKVICSVAHILADVATNLSQSKRRKL